MTGMAAARCNTLHTQDAQHAQDTLHKNDELEVPQACPRWDREGT